MHLGLIPGNRLSFKEHLTLVFSKINKVIGLLHKLQCVVLRVALLAIYKTFVRSHLNYGEMIYEQAYNSFFY